MVMIDIIIAPPSAPQINVLALAGIEHPLAGEVLDTVRRRGPVPVGFWKLINTLANARNPDSRARRRCWRLRYWGAVRELLKVKLLFRHDAMIAPVDFAWRPRPRIQERGPFRPLNGDLHLSSSVSTWASEIPGSDPVAPMVETATKHRQIVHAELEGATNPASPSAPETKCAAPTREEITMAARSLAQLPRRRKIWSGWLHGRRAWRSMLVIVPGGQVLPAYFVRRGWVYVFLPDTPEFKDRLMERYRAEDVQIHRSAHAALLGHLPPRPGRKRGRPRKVEPSASIVQ